MEQQLRVAIEVDGETRYMTPLAARCFRREEWRKTYRGAKENGQKRRQMNQIKLALKLLALLEKDSVTPEFAQAALDFIDSVCGQDLEVKACLQKVRESYR